MNVKTQSLLASLNPAYRKEKVRREDIDRLKTELPLLLDRTTGKVSESQLRDHLQTFLRGTGFPQSEFLVQSEVRKMDTVIHDGPKKKDPIGLICEVKTRDNAGELFHPERPNVKALHELVLYFLRERQTNTALKQLIITNGADVYLFADREFDRLFWDRKRFRSKVLTADADKNNTVAYEIIQKHVAELDDTLHVTHTDLSYYRPWCEDGRDDTDDRLIPLYKILSPVHLLRRPFAGDSNSLDKRFYRELLHIIGLEEVSVDSKGKVKKSGGKKIIRRATGAARHPASLLENTLQVATKENRFRKVTGWREYGDDDEERRFAVCLELCLTWVNRILFLKLLETQLASYHPEEAGNYRFLTPQRLPDFDALNTLFFDVLNKPEAERESIVSDFSRVPYLNSSLFEISALEDQVIRVNSLKDQFHLPLAPSSVLGTRGRAQIELAPLAYLLDFLDAYDFGAQGKARIQEDNKRLINASVLGLIFEKINGYRDGSFYTPGFITEYMCRQTIRRAVVQKFRNDNDLFAAFDAENFDDLRSFLTRDNYKAEVRTAANALVNSITVCDPAVGSGHFLVSALNELIATKSALGILGADAGAGRELVRAVVENDELIITYRDRHYDGEPYEYHATTLADGRLDVSTESQEIQRTLFEEKRTLIENCLFGVDLNPNSVKICRLRLWIELLKNAYYVLPDAGNPAAEVPAAYLQTLPNIDINIKQGNSLISRFKLDDDLSDALKDSGFSLIDYRCAVADYHRAKGHNEKERLRELLASIKRNFQSYISRNDKRVKQLSKDRGALTKLQSLLEMGDLFGSVDTAEVRKKMKPLEKKVEKLEAELAAVAGNVIYEQAFEWRFEFPAVLGENGVFEGFNVLVGNPPYIRQEELKDVKPYLKDHYQVYAGTADLLVYFIELSMNNLRPGGQFSFIVSNKFMRAGFGKALRKYIPQFRVHELLDFGDLPVFDGATTYPLVISLEKSAPTGTFTAANLEELARTNFREHLGSVSFQSLQTGLAEDGWNLADVATQQLLAKLRQTGVPLGEYVDGKIYYGIKTGYNQAFVIDAATRDRLIAADARSAEVIKPFLAGRDVKRYVPPVANKYLIFTRRGINIEAFPAIKHHLNQYQTELTPKPSDWPKNEKWPGRKEGSYAWYEIQDSVNYYEEFEKPKIMYQVFQVKPVFTYDTQGAYGNNSIWIVPTEDISLIAILNSCLGWWMISQYCTAIQNGYQLIFKYLQRVTIIPTNRTLISLASQILQEKEQDPTTDTTALEAQIDLLVYQLYNLTHEEVLIVDPEFALSKSEYAALEA